MSKIGRKSVPECRFRKVYCGFRGVCAYLLDVICILDSEYMIIIDVIREEIEEGTPWANAFRGRPGVVRS